MKCKMIQQSLFFFWSLVTQLRTQCRSYTDPEKELTVNTWSTAHSQTTGQFLFTKTFLFKVLTVSGFYFSIFFSYMQCVFLVTTGMTINKVADPYKQGKAVWLNNSMLESVHENKKLFDFRRLWSWGLQTHLLKVHEELQLLAARRRQNLG